MTARTTGAITLLVAALALAGCAAQPAGTADDAAASASSSPEAAAPAESEEPTTPADDAAADDAPAEAEGAYVDYTEGVIEQTAGPKVLFFHADWCPNCRELDAELRADGAPDGLTVIKVDYDSSTDLRQQYGVTMQTTVVYVDDDGEALSSAVLYEEPSIAALVAAAP
ncbi:thiol-disulfide isomerase/thioredoxin [Agromyces terreus]|uniref:Thiol-disulfide isomerase/thioredoxin n=1 Tax=Agromyces terreus TaxID=424795 RepID=A0A9X2KB18_9MICO|nr:thioredoxin family protein [Agromyces terreus]MCP2370134.1 thiol-disulfide isomerase/thioredoxin [Agromyces terreus]